MATEIVELRERLREYAAYRAVEWLFELFLRPDHFDVFPPEVREVLRKRHGEGVTCSLQEFVDASVRVWSGSPVGGDEDDPETDAAYREGEALAELIVCRMLIAASHTGYLFAAEADRMLPSIATRHVFPAAEEER